jgi:GTP-binding protein EngB required for normal cell division
LKQKTPIFVVSTKFDKINVYQKFLKEKVIQDCNQQKMPKTVVFRAPVWSWIIAVSNVNQLFGIKNETVMFHFHPANC